MLVACKKDQTKSADPDQTASIEAVWSGSYLFDILTRIVQIPALIANFLFENKKR